MKITERQPEDIIERILKEDRTQKAYNLGISVATFKEKVKKGELAYLGLSEEEIAKKVTERLGSNW